MKSPLSWVRNRRLSQKLPRCLILDRDGILNEHIKGGYVLQWSDFVWRPGAVAALRKVAAIDLPMIVVTNQSCIGRGLIGRDEIVAIMDRVVADLDDADVHLDAWYCCPHAPSDTCVCRKPAAGMLLAAAAELHVDLEASYLVGDSMSDIEAGRAVGCATWLVDQPSDFSRAIADIVERERITGANREVTPC